MCPLSAPLPGVQIADAFANPRLIQTNAAPARLRIQESGVGERGARALGEITTAPRKRRSIVFPVRTMDGAPRESRFSDCELIRR